MKIVSNTGPIIGLAKIGLLFILNRLASEVVIPPMVHKELLGKIGGDVLVLMDDRAGRQIASRLNISVSGIVGLLLLAKEKGVLEKIAHHLEGLRAEGYWLSDEVIKVARKIAGEN
jgi:predicted nucleic acid-binding protein